MLGKLLKYDWKANYLYLMVGYVVYIVLTLGFVVSFRWMDRSVGGSELEGTLQWITMMTMTFLWVASMIGVVLMTYILLIRRFYCHMVSDQGYLTLTLPVSARTHMLSKLISAVIFILLTGCVLAAGVVMAAASFGREHFVADFLRVMGNVFRQLGTSFSILACVSGLLGLLQTILQIYFSICVGQLCNKHKVWGSIGVYLGITFVTNILSNIVAIVAGVVGNGGLLLLFMENIYGVLYVVFLLAMCLIYFFGGAWLLEKRTNLE